MHYLLTGAEYEALKQAPKQVLAQLVDSLIQSNTVPCKRVQQPVSGYCGYCDGRPLSGWAETETGQRFPICHKDRQFSK